MQAADRSFRLSLSCGSSHVLRSATEPEKCKYAANFTTPAACEEADAARLASQVAELEHVQAQLEVLVRQQEQEQQQSRHEEL